jgi:hypothetical protein
MARNAEIEAILEAWWETEHCPLSERAKAEIRLNGLLDGVVAKGRSTYTREQILDYLYPQYRDHRLAKRKAERVGVAQSALKK